MAKSKFFQKNGISEGIPKDVKSFLQLLEFVLDTFLIIDDENRQDSFLLNSLAVSTLQKIQGLLLLEERFCRSESIRSMAEVIRTLYVYKIS